MSKPKLAAIYIRVSSEAQAEPGKASPEIQEADCRAYCERAGYEVAEVYRDTEKYRSHGRLVEPSGTRSDRPAFLRMLQDNDDGKFQTLIAWREDRLYRGVSMAVVGIKDRVKAGKLNVELVNGHFDVRTAELWAWVAGQENEARVDRHKMGMRGRLQRGLINIPTGIYGYTITGGIATINEPEAVWVRQIWAWYATGIGMHEIRRRLITADAPQLESGAKRRKRKWSLSVIETLLHREAYGTGVYHATLAGETYPARIPKIVDGATYSAVQERFRRWKARPNGNIKADMLLAGKVFCASCGSLLGVKSHRAIVKPSTGETKLYRYYVCVAYSKGYAGPDCCKSIRHEACDINVWNCLYSVLSEDGRFELAVSDRIRQLQAAEDSATRDSAALSRELDDANAERDRCIDLYVKGTITEDGLEKRLLEIDIRRKQLERDLKERRILLGGQADRLTALADAFRANVRGMLADLHPDSTPTDKKAAKTQFELKRRFVDALVHRVEVDSEKMLSIHMEVGLSPAEGLRDDALLIALLPSWVNPDDRLDSFSFVVTAKVGA